MYDIIFADKAKRQFLKLEKTIQERIGAVLERIKIRPEHFVEKLIGEPGYKLRIGDYRALIDVDFSNKILKIQVIGHRKKIYKRFNKE
jgi:mRNA interferase RelE/StbE